MWKIKIPADTHLMSWMYKRYTVVQAWPRFPQNLCLVFIKNMYIIFPFDLHTFYILKVKKYCASHRIFWNLYTDEWINWKEYLKQLVWRKTLVLYSIKHFDVYMHVMFCFLWLIFCRHADTFLSCCVRIFTHRFPSQFILIGIPHY